MDLVAVPEGQPADDLVLAAAQRLQGLGGVRLVAGLAVNRAVEGDEGVDGQDRRPLGRLGGDRLRLAPGVLAGDLDRVALGELLGARDDRAERDAELLEDRPPLRRAAG